MGATALAAPAAAAPLPVRGIDTVLAATLSAPHPAQDFSAQQRRPRTAAPRTYSPRPTPRSNPAPRYIYPGSRDALDTCAFC